MTSEKIQKIMGLDKPYKFRLAAVIAADTRKGTLFAVPKSKGKSEDKTP